MDSSLEERALKNNGGLSIGSFSVLKRQFHRDLLDDRQNSFGSMG